MIFTLFNNPIVFVLLAFSIVIAITIHEFAHAKVADLLGDPTPGLQGRLTLNPRSHLDLYGVIFLLFIGFGWGKPVQIDPFNLQNPRRDSALIALAGPISNFIFALVLAFILFIFKVAGLGWITSIGFFILTPMITMNVMLGVFNLLPIHPLDGFNIVSGVLNENKSREWNQLRRYGMIFLLLLIFPFAGQSMLHTIMDPILSFIYNLLIPVSKYSMFI